MTSGESGVNSRRLVVKDLGLCLLTVTVGDPSWLSGGSSLVRVLFCLRLCLLTVTLPVPRACLVARHLLLVSVLFPWQELQSKPVGVVYEPPLRSSSERPLPGAEKHTSGHAILFISCRL